MNSKAKYRELLVEFVGLRTKNGMPIEGLLLGLSNRIDAALAEPASQCKCSMAISILGDGCRYCQPQEYIDRLIEQTEDDVEEVTPAEVPYALRQWAMDDEPESTLFDEGYNAARRWVRMQLEKPAEPSKEGEV